MKYMDSKRWFFSVVLSLAFIFFACGLCVYIIDPYFHYRRPDNRLTYGNAALERYMDAGIVKNFDYNAVITGTSMAENFKSSEFNGLFHLESIKVPLAGGSFKEVGDLCKAALSQQPDLQIIFRGLDLSNLAVDKDAMSYYSYPEYLYNDRRLDDVNYLLDKHALVAGCGMNVIMTTIMKRETFNFDTYSNWNNDFEFGKEIVLSSYERPAKSESFIRLSAEERTIIRDNIEQNVIEIAAEYPDTRFILFLTPYSICYWDTLSQNGVLLKNIEIQEEVIELLIPYDNIELYSFCDNFELVCNLNNYMDWLHYSEDVSSDILRWIAEGDYKITKDNYKQYLNKIMEFYSNYDYDSIYK